LVGGFSSFTSHGEICGKDAGLGEKNCNYAVYSIEKTPKVLAPKNVATWRANLWGLLPTCIGEKIKG
jgi:hypothetical protein